MAIEIDKNKHEDMYRTMVRIREFEINVERLSLEGRLPGFVHLYIGEEAIATGVCAALREDDYITSTHRGHGHCVAKGGSLEKMFAEIHGKRTGYCKGKGGSMHIAAVEKGILGANGIVGGGFTIATGAAFSAKYQGTDQVCVCFFGDGASNKDTFHEGINLAAVWGLPAIFVCENNEFGMSVPQKKHQKIRDISLRAQGYGIPGVTIDGNDVMLVYETALEAVNRAREGGGPTLIECKTYRHKGHFVGDPEPYRVEEEVKKWITERDPIQIYKDYLLKSEILSEKDLEAIHEEIQEEITDAIRFAEESPLPNPEETLEDLYVD
ncbi:MAG: thiamine pyrophosphate-dependent dehydrogenase E1 component subunit alpha [Deltaproteobacteria bacterium]|nr:MAG: thiamine pyrophosphate-dependent dehydrogenase E1 component subunit alpha [Deltaproteobacteria bacterium]